MKKISATQNPCACLRFGLSFLQLLAVTSFMYAAYCPFTTLRQEKAEIMCIHSLCPVGLFNCWRPIVGDSSYARIC